MAQYVGVAEPQPRSSFTIEGLSPKSDRRSTAATYLLAFLFGLALAAYMLPAKTIFATDIRVRPVYQYDAAMNVYGQRYFTKDSWHWPLLTVKKLGAPQGTNVGFMDGIPLAEIVVKIFRHFLPPDFHSVYVWFALCWVLQPVAAVFALRSAGERRLIPNLAVAVIAASMPALLFRFMHSALCSHFLILIALGLYFRITRSPKLSTLIGAGVLILTALLVNPYIMEMVIAVLVAAPLTLMIRRDPAWLRVTAGVGGGVVIAAIVALLLGYGRAVPMGGFGVFSMNLLSPIYPGLATSGQFIDATGGQYEGYQYLGMGLILLLLLADFCLSMRERLDLLRRHAGLVIACVILTLLALSTKIYAGPRLLLTLPTPHILLELRGSGRLFWPVAYALLIAGTLIVCRKLNARWAMVTLLVLASLQYVESFPMRREVRRILRSRRGYVIDTALFRPLLADHSKLVVWPKFGCGGDPRTPEFSDLYLLASEVAIPVNMTYVGRFAREPNCDFSQVPVTVAPGELWVFVPQWNSGMIASVVDWRDICRKSGPLVVCAQDLRGRTDLPVPSLPTLALDKTTSAAADAPGQQWLISGWYPPEPWGTWTEGAKAYLTANLDKPLDRPVVLKVWASGLAAHPSETQKVTVIADGQPIAVWNVKEGTESEYSASIPPPAVPTRKLVVEFQVDHPISPKEDGLGPDPREVGFGLSAFRLEE